MVHHSFQIYLLARKSFIFRCRDQLTLIWMEGRTSENGFSKYIHGSMASDMKSRKEVVSLTTSLKTALANFLTTCQKFGDFVQVLIELTKITECLNAFYWTCSSHLSHLPILKSCLLFTEPAWRIECHQDAQKTNDMTMTCMRINYNI